MHFVLDESSWAWDGHEPGLYIERIEQLLDRLDVAHQRDESFAASSELLTQKLVNQQTLADLLWGTNGDLHLPYTVRERLTVMLGPLRYWDDDGEYTGFDAEIGGIKVFSPSAVFAHTRVGAGETTACLPLPGTWRGPCVVVVDGRGEQVYFVTDEATHRGFFRDAILVRKVEGAIEPWAPHAFPDTYFPEGIWRGLRAFNGGYIRVREDLLRFLALFDDHATWIYKDASGRLSEDEPMPNDGQVYPIDNQLVAKRFGALGLSVAPEAREVYDTLRSRTAREVMVGARTLYCEWHYKVEPHTNRVHFHCPVPESAMRPIVAIFHEHLYLPGD